jgi:predicted SAM-dependent methyltransferase
MKLDLGGGAGYKMPPDFHIVDISGGNTTWDLRNVPLPFDDGSVELIHCSHTLEHITKAEAKNLLATQVHVVLGVTGLRVGGARVCADRASQSQRRAARPPIPWRLQS